MWLEMTLGGGGRDLVSMKVDDASKLVQAFRGNDWGGDIFYFDV